MSEEYAWIKWHFSKWRGDPALRMCSLAARGLWIDLLSYMHECQPYGHLLIAGRAPTERQIAALVGMTNEKEVSACLAELRDNGVFSIDDAGVMYSRRMVRDKAAREEGRRYGAKGGNPNLTKRDNPPKQAGDNQGGRGRVNPPDETPLNTDKNKKREEERREDSRSLRSLGEPEEVPPREPSAAAKAREAEAAFERFWPRYPRRDGKGSAKKAFLKALVKASEAEILAGLARYRFSPEPQYVPLPATWLNDERWLSEQTAGPVDPATGRELPQMSGALF